MGVVLAGIDEAGYGPLLGPLTIGLSVFRLAGWDGAGSASVPNLWKVLEEGICCAPGRGGRADPKGRIAIADSKQLKLANSIRSAHPLVHLERGVLGMLRVGGGAEINDDESLFAAIRAERGGHTCYGGEALRLPVAIEASDLGIACNVASRAFRKAGVEMLAMRCRLVSEGEFNRVVRERRNKAATSGQGVAEHLRFVWERWGDRGTPEGAGDRLGIVCDRLGGRAAYGDFLAETLGASVEVVEESAHRSRYVVTYGTRRAGVAFVVGADAGHVPVALASMIAKYTRELCMIRFNRFWSAAASRDGRSIETLRPTAGYAQDARRWLHDARGVLDRSDLEQLVRIA